MRVALLWQGAGALYIGPLVGAAAAACQTCRIYLPLEAPLLLEQGERVSLAETGTPVLALAGEAHRVASPGGLGACLLLDRSATPPARLHAALANARFALRLRSWIDALEALGPDLERAARRRPDLLNPFASPADETDGRLQAGLRVLRRDPAAPGVLGRAAAAAGWSASRFRHVARRRTGLSLKRYRLWAKLARATAMARAGESLTEAALGAGFSSSSHLSAAHAAMFGTSPSDVLRRLRATSPGSAPPVEGAFAQDVRRVVPLPLTAPPRPLTTPRTAA